MVNSRKIGDLHQKVQPMAEDLIRQCREVGIDIISTSTYRDIESQNELYAQGRTKPGKKVTNVKGGDSFHNWRVAFDVVPIRNGKAVWGTTGADFEIWEQVGNIGESLGLEWGGNWKKFKDYPHFQYTQGLSITDFKNGKNIS